MFGQTIPDAPLAVNAPKIDGLHFHTLNKSKATRQIVENLRRTGRTAVKKRLAGSASVPACGRWWGATARGSSL
jgi:hypothetical protein